MGSMIKTVQRFQRSINIEYDLNDDDKLRSFVPTSASLDLLRTMLMSTRENAANRARILIGAYGKGKSHMVLASLGILMQRDRGLFERIVNKADDKMRSLITQYYDNALPLLPVCVNGISSREKSLSQMFVISLERTLSQNGITNIMPDTAWGAAISTIDRWRRDFPETYDKFSQCIECPIDEFEARLAGWNENAYQEFETVYPMLSAGAAFQPLYAFDAAEIYQSVAQELQRTGKWGGLYVVWDEFGKYLEANIAYSTSQDMKTLQDFAEMCCRSGEKQVHLMLICHKEIENYIDVLPKEKVDGWRGVSERFEHVRVNNDFSSVYDIIESALEHDNDRWQTFCLEHSEDFASLSDAYKGHEAFKGLSDDERGKLFETCYPLHPSVIFTLPRLSEKAAQNERTMFTFLATDAPHTLCSFLAKANDAHFSLVRLPLLYDYFAPLLQGNETFMTSQVILRGMSGDHLLDLDLVKSLAILWIEDRFDEMRPTEAEIVRIFSPDTPYQDIKDAINSLVSDKRVLYPRRNDDLLQLIKPSTVNVQEEIANQIAKIRMPLDAILNTIYNSLYLYPARHNDQYCITRYFVLRFINGDDNESDWGGTIEKTDADGVILAVVGRFVQERLIAASSLEGLRKALFVYQGDTSIDIYAIAKELLAVKLLSDEADKNDIALLNEYNLIQDDLACVVDKFVSRHIRPRHAVYIWQGKEKVINNRVELSQMLSDICDKIYPNAPIINNEVINRNNISSMTRKSRGNVISSILSGEQSDNLNSGNGQDAFIMRTLMHCASKLDCVYNEINAFIGMAKDSGKVSFSHLYERLMGLDAGIGARRGAIPVYIAKSLYPYKKDVTIIVKGEEKPLSRSAIEATADSPNDCILVWVAWNVDREKYIKHLSVLFASKVDDVDDTSFNILARAMREWRFSLPKCAREMRCGEDSEKAFSFLKSLTLNISGYSLLFEYVPKALGIFDDADFETLCNEIDNAKRFFDDAAIRLRSSIVAYLSSLFDGNWFNNIPSEVFEHSFNDDTRKALVVIRDVMQKGNDKAVFIDTLSLMAVGIKMEDWDDSTKDAFHKRVEQWKKTAESYTMDADKSPIDKQGGYTISFCDDSGKAQTRTFADVPTSSMGKLLERRLMTDISEMGTAVGDSEKRRILAKILIGLC